MIDTQLVEEKLKMLASFDSGVPEMYAGFIENAALGVYGRLKDCAYESDGRVIFLAAARAYYYIVCSGAGADTVVSFSAGDVSLVENPQEAADVAALIVKQAEADCAGLVYDGGFAFSGV